MYLGILVHENAVSKKDVREWATARVKELLWLNDGLKNDNEHGEYDREIEENNARINELKTLFNISAIIEYDE
jgi:hypothetical protein